MSDGAVKMGGTRWPWTRTLLHEEGDVYMIQWFSWARSWIKRIGGAQIHHFHSDDGIVPHDHPSWMLCIVLWGSARETVYFPDDQVPKYAWWQERFAPRWMYFVGNLPRIRLYRLGLYTHRIHKTKNLWTLCIRGPHRREWGFRKRDGTWVGIIANSAENA